MKNRACVIGFLFLLSLGLFQGQHPVTASSVSNVARINDTFYPSLADAVLASSAGDTIYVLEDLSLTSQITITKDVTIRSENELEITLKRAFNGILLRVTGNTSLTLTNIIIDGNKSVYTGNSGSHVYLSGDTTNHPVLNLEEGAILENNRTTNGASAVQVAYGTLNMLGGIIRNNQADYGISAIYGGADSLAINLLGGEITNNYTTNSSLVAAVQASLFSSISIGGNMIIKDNYKGTSTPPTASNAFTDLDVGTKQMTVANEFTGLISIYSTDIARSNYRLSDIFGNLAEGASIAGGQIINNRNPFLLGTENNANQIIWDYAYTAPTTINEPTSTQTGLIRRYAYVDSTTVPSTTVYKDIVLPALNPTDYSISYDATDDTVTYIWNDDTHGEYSFVVSFANCDIESAIVVANTRLDHMVTLDASDEIKSIVADAKTTVDAATSVASIVEILSSTEVLIIDQLIIESQQVAYGLLNDYIGNPINPSQEITDIIATSINAINASNYQDIGDILSQAQALLDIQLLIEEKAKSISQIDLLITSLTSTPSTSLLALQSDAITAINATTSIEEVQATVLSYSAEINALYLKENIDFAKAKLDDLVASFSGEPSANLLALLTEAMTNLDSADNISEINTIVTTYENLLKHQKLDEVAAQFAETYNTYANTNRYQYSDEGLELLDAIFANGEDFFNDTNNDIMDIISTLEDAIIDLSEVAIVRVGDFNPDDDNFNEDLYSSTIFNGVATPSIPVQSDSRLVVDILEMDQLDSIYQSMLASQIIPQFNPNSVDIIRDSFVNQIIFSKIKISLLDNDNIPVPLPAQSEYIITLLLPDIYRTRTDINLITFSGENVEVYGVTRNKNLITFTVDQLGDFYLVGDMIQNETSPMLVDPILNLWWVIILLIVFLVGEVVFVVMTHLKKTNQKKLTNKKALFFNPLLLTIIPNQAILWIILLAIIVICTGVYIALLLLSKKKMQKDGRASRAKNEDLVKPEDIKAKETKPAAKTMNRGTENSGEK